MQMLLSAKDTLNLWIIFICNCIVLNASNLGFVRATPACAFHMYDGVSAESEGVRFIRLREDAEIGKEILLLRAYPRSAIALRSVDNSGDHKYFGLSELNTTTVRITLTRSIEDLVDRDVPRNLLKFRVVCAGKNEKLEEGSYISITVYIEDVNDNAPEFLNTPYIVDVDENTPPGTIVFEGIQAFDRDKPNTPNSEVHFSMSTVPEQLSADGSPYFSLKSPHRPLLILKKDLDFDNGIRLFKLPLFAWDRGTPANQVNTTITINVRDVDDLPPKFTEGVYRTKINEFYPMTGIPIRVPLYFSPPIMAFDQDSLNATLIYEIISGNERKLFRVNPNNGIMYLQKEVDLEEESLPGNTFVLQVEARQRENPLRKAVARIEVEVLDLNDNVPEFEADFYNISIVENLPTGFSVLQVNAIDRDQGENAEFLYQLTEEPEAADAFRIDARTGWITVNDDRLLDREQRKSLHLMVEAIERHPPYMPDINLRKPGPSKVKVDITLLDTNDNTPKFENGNLYEFKVPITAPMGYKVGQVVALDPDEGPNGLLLYELQRPKGSGYIPFQLDTKNGTIYVNGPLRRGRIAVFVEASDQPTNPSERRFSLAVITIEVYATIDDQVIDFVGAPYEFWVGSNAPLGTSVGQVRTTLIYEGEDEIMYDLLHTYSEGVPFAIEERSGIITVIRELSEFTRKVYLFEAVANYLFANSTKALIMSRSSPPATTAPTPTELTDEGVLITNVTIHVVMKPENKVPMRPVIEEINMNVIHFHIEENIVGGIIGQLLYKNGVNVLNNELGTYRQFQTTSNVTMGSRFRSRSRSRNTSSARMRSPRRLASDTNLKLRYIIANQQEVVNKISIAEDGTLLTLTGLDREEKDQYDLTVIVEYTTGLVSGAGIYQVTVEVDDVNDNAPKFNSLSYVGLINENSISGTEISVNQPIQITDADLGKNAEFRLILQGDYSDQFTIDFYNASKEAQNKSRHALQTPATFSVFNLTDQWNEEFKFVEMQNMLMQSDIRLTSGPYFRVTYSGKRPLDREKDQIYKLKLIAIDTGGLTTYSHLNILVADVNDNAPIFERISVFKESKVEIREYTTDMEIYFVDNSAVQMMGMMSSAMVVPPYHIPGSPRLSSEFSFNNSFADVRQQRGRRLRKRLSRGTGQSPIMKCPLFAIYENTPISTKVLQIMASDEDYGSNALVHYELVAEHVDRPIVGAQFSSRFTGARHFAIDKLSGELTVNYPLAANLDMLLNLTATDIDGLRDVTCLRFTVVDVNDHAPVFKKSWYSFDTEEGEYRDSVLGQVLAVDLDYGENANISYSLSETDLPFKIKELSGVIKITGLLDREVHPKYNFQVIATDNAEPLYRMSSTVDIEVNVMDINDNKPEFIGYDDVENAEKYIADLTDRTLTLPIYKAYLDRSTKPGMFVKQVNAIDKDYVGNGNGLVLYSILHQDIHNPIFQIDSRDGTITTVASFRSYNDYEHLNVTVVASDLGSPAHSSTAVVLINLQGQAVTEPTTDDTEPPNEQRNVTIFQHQYHEVQVLENNMAPLQLIKINITNGLNPEVFRWSLIIEETDEENFDAQPLFELDPKTTTLFALKSFDRELKSRYQLRVRADRLNREPRNYARISYPVTDERVDGLDPNECRIIVNIQDENDNEPRFKSAGQAIIAVVPRTATFGYPVTIVKAFDADEGINAEIRYRLLNEPSRLFGIDELTGKIRLIGIIPMDQRVYGFDVKATDRGGADDGRSSIVNVFVYIIDEARQVRIVVAGKPVEVEQRIDALMHVLSEAIQMDVRVRLLEPHVGGLEPATDAYIYAVDYRTNAILEMEQLQELLAGLQLDALQLQQQQGKDGNYDHKKIMPRIIELAEFGQLTHNTPHSGNFISGLEIVSIVLIVLCGIGATMIALCFLCLRQKRSTIWTQPEFPSSETGLTYSVARTGLAVAGSRRQHRHRQRQLQHKQQQQHKQLQQQQQVQLYGKSVKTTSSFIPESVCSSSSHTPSTAVAASPHSEHQHKQQQQHHQQPHNQLQSLHPAHQHSHHHPHSHNHALHSHLNHYTQSGHAQQQQLQQVSHQQLADQRQREYIDVPLPKSVAKLAASNRSTTMENEPTSLPFVLSYNVRQPVNNLSPSAYETSMFSLHSNGQDSGVDFRSSRELYETSPDSFKTSSPHSQNLNASELLCPRHAKHKHSNNNIANGSGCSGTVAIGNDSSDNYEDSLKNDEPLVASNCRSSQHSSLCDHHHRNDYQNTNFEKRSGVRHSFSGVKDDLVQHSPQISLRPRGHILRNSMNDLEERLHNLEQSFRRPMDYTKSSSIF
ncbi:cadherin-89D [Bactrocera neohumeralis]|uniref:cadherin-89D n=1 Tax=Bactrocera neohumeralis TaxID=98809 RepID=UPI002165E130|nr:cadherin-89D [Bactrocera neohumeralis]